MEAGVVRKPPDAPGRTCVGCGRKRGQGELVRISAGPAGLTVQFGRGDGRGAYLCLDARCLESVIKRKALQKVLKADLGPLSVAHLREAIDRAVGQRILRLLGLAHRARRVVAGVRGVMRALEAGRVHLVLLGREMSPRGGRQLQAVAESKGIPVVADLSRDELTLALGGPSREVIGLLDGAFADGILIWLRLRASVSAGVGESGDAEGSGTGGGRRGEDARI
ncbi:MAG: DUF448 domain-containing protein [candidate division NC10 bacterium]|nr:DUF448 domain-containing protein [candidate division NC10 bacterium]